MSCYVLDNICRLPNIAFFTDELPCLVNGKCYIGQSTDVNKRLAVTEASQHIARVLQWVVLYA